MTPWKLPPPAKVYEAFSALADKRVRLEEPGRATVQSSGGEKTYTVAWTDDFAAVTSNDNASYWQGYLGYPIVAVLIAAGKVRVDETAPRVLAGIDWHALNERFRARLRCRRRPCARRTRSARRGSRARQARGRQRDGPARRARAGACGPRPAAAFPKLRLARLELLRDDRGLRRRALVQVKPKPSQPEVYDTDHVLFSHPLDALRHLLVNLPQPVIDDWEPGPTAWDPRGSGTRSGAGRGLNSRRQRFARCMLKTSDRRGSPLTGLPLRRVGCRLGRAQKEQAMTDAAVGRPQRSPHASVDPYKGKWSTLSNTTLGMLMASIDASIVLIALPDIFRGIHLNPLLPGNTSYFLWLLMGYMLVTAVLVVSFGRLGDIFGRVRMYNMGFALFTVFSIMLSVTWMHGRDAVLFMIIMRVFQGVGGALTMANSMAILTDAFPPKQRGLALGTNMMAAIAGSFIGLVLGGILGPLDWRLVLLVSCRWASSAPSGA